MDTNPDVADNLVDKTFGSPNKDCSQSTGPGEGAGGVHSNCGGLGKVMIIQHENVAEAIAHVGGGDIVFDFDDEASTVMKLSLFNVLSGGRVGFELVDGSEHEIEISPMEENEVLQLQDLDMQGVMKITIHFDGLGAIASLGVCRDPRKTPAPAPYGFAPPVETNKPTAAPTIATSMPSASPTKALVPIPAPEDCPENVELLHQVGATSFPDIPIEVIEQNTQMVKFRVRNSFSKTIARIFTQFSEQISGETECYEDVEIEEFEYKEYTAYCMQHVPISIVDIWVSDASLDASLDNAEVPRCCHPPEDDTNPKTQYTFKIWCESQCPENDNTRQLLDQESASSLESHYIDSLREAQKQAVNPRGFKTASETTTNESTEDGERHFCQSEDYPCGDELDMVYVCHYSAKDGFQTFCVHEPDSDIMGYYPKDYCGRCRGGYGTGAGGATINPRKSS